MSWKDIEGYQMHYQVNEYGNVRTLYKNGKVKELKPFLDKDGYYRVRLVLIHNEGRGKRKNVPIHRLVAEAFIPNPKNLETVDHIDCNKTNNYVKNLQWMSIEDNSRKSILTMNRETNGRLKPRCGDDV